MLEATLVTVFAAVFVLTLLGIVVFLTRRMFRSPNRLPGPSLTSRGPIDRNAPPPISDRVLEIAIDPNRKIEACKAYIDETGVSLRDAKAIIEFYSDEYHRR